MSLIIEAILFVLSSGLLFSERFRKNWPLVSLAAVIAIVSSILLGNELSKQVMDWWRSVTKVEPPPQTDTRPAPTPATPPTVVTPHGTPPRAGSDKLTGFNDCSDCPQLVEIKPGSFTMGAPPDVRGALPFERPAHAVAIARPYALGKFEVTFDEWDTCVEAGGCPALPDFGWGRGHQPVVGVTWDKAVQYVDWLRKKTGKPYRLPTEAEWEFAAQSVFSDTDHELNERLIGETNVKRRTTLVDRFPEDSKGLHGMAGNVWEWVEDCWNESYAGKPPVDGSAWMSGDCTQHVLRGGSWQDGPEFRRPSSRFRSLAGLGYNYNGFRVARDM